jgi:hypothetical protein
LGDLRTKVEVVIMRQQVQEDEPTFYQPQLVSDQLNVDFPASKDAKIYLEP